ncbi:FKBP-type peptidyl-prolyl cis-trans isomerase 2 [Roseomonas alkaliterrae]|uniref:FKBP-type peptidyl-prolyl cis-trans isomerase 2 n=1 Tax=Neoroseomonas alkaliterrae TaxID=1452450 RepID=A0A840XQD3_9PROT|nr:FKBP-type peptidyl-prolyl cis-trans isomerase 2 [Neoroseomonas alkaliterrae]
MTGTIEPGMRVRLPSRPDWGTGQVQSVIGDRITVNFEHAGKVLINAAVAELEVQDGDDRRG